MSTLSQLLLKRLMTVVENNLIPNHQFGFREKHSTVNQIHKITNVMNKSLVSKMVWPRCVSRLFQAFDKAWYLRLLYKIKDKFTTYVLLNYTFLHAGRVCQVKFWDATSPLLPVGSGVPRSSVLGSSPVSSVHLGLTVRKWYRYCYLRQRHSNPSETFWPLKSVSYGTRITKQRSVMAVSYTHLDVYKRQTINSLKINV